MSDDHPAAPNPAPDPPHDEPVMPPDAASSAASSAASPRAFAQGTGWVLQSLGIILLLINCCVCSVAGIWEDALTEEASVLDQAPPEPLSLYELAQEPGKAGLMIMVFGCTAGGLALAAFGLGMQSEKPRSAWGAVITCGLLIATLILAALGLWSDQTSLLTRGWGGLTVMFVARTWNALMIVLLAVATGFSIAALRQMRRFPPDPNLHVLPPDFEIPPDPLGPHGKRRKRY